MKISRKDMWALLFIVGVVSLLLMKGVFIDYLPLRDSNRWTSGVVYKKSKGGTSEYVYYSYCLGEKCFNTSQGTRFYNKVILDSVKYIVAYNPDKPSQSKILLDLPTVEAELGTDLDSLKSVYNRELSFWKDF